jgi:glycosyltransferase involved in cell wall biosynthesis
MPISTPMTQDNRSRDSQLIGLGSQTSGNRVRPWIVVHACDLARQVSDVIDAQAHVGIQPYLLTMNGERPRNAQDNFDPRTAPDSPVSLLQTWQDVRKWRKLIDENGTYVHVELVHSHSFAAGMAAARGSDAAVYDVRHWIEEQAGANSWLARSFRTAEQFAITRSSAVVVHSQAKRMECIDRGVAAADVFLVPDPITFRLEKDGAESAPDKTFGVDYDSLGSRKGTVSIAARISRTQVTQTGKDVRSSLSLEDFLLAFVQAWQEIDLARAILIVPSDLLLSVSQKARALDIRDKVTLAPEQDASRALAAADIVLADAMVTEGGTAEHEKSSTALAAMSGAKAVLAEDNDRNRELSPDGRGLLWYSAEQKSVVRDLGHRLAFLVRNSDFRIALGQGGHRFLLQERNPERIGALYDEVYRHAFNRRQKGGRSQDASGSLIPVQTSI